jgi:hypothetical protein
MFSYLLQLSIDTAYQITKEMPCLVISSTIININVRILFVWHKCLPVARPSTKCDAEFLYYTVGYLPGLVLDTFECNLDWSHANIYADKCLYSAELSYDIF